jgi:uncharacterized membrane protein
MTDSFTPPVSPAPEPFGLGAPANDNEKLLAGLAYWSQMVVPAVLPAILLLTDESKRSEFVKRHAAQSLALLVAAVVYEIVAAIVYAIGVGVAPCLTCLLWLLFLLPTVPLAYYGVLAFQGKEIEIPYVSKLMRDNHWL